MNEENSEAEFEEQPSKSQRKREMHALQALGQELTELSESELLSLELPTEILDAVREMHRIPAARSAAPALAVYRQGDAQSRRGYDSSAT